MIAQGMSAAGVMEACGTIEDPSKPWLRVDWSRFMGMACLCGCRLGRHRILVEDCTDCTCLRYEAAGEDRCAD